MSEAALRERVEHLEAENADLRARLRLMPEEGFIGSARVALKLRPAQARMLWTLWDCRVKSKEAIHAAMYGDQIDQPGLQILTVYACQIRAAINPLGADLETHFAFGWRLLPADRAIIAAHIGIEVKP